MRTDRRSTTLAAITPAAALSRWPALLNANPLASAHIGNDLSLAIEHSVGWSRPVFSE